MNSSLTKFSRSIILLGKHPKQSWIEITGLFILFWLIILLKIKIKWLESILWLILGIIAWVWALVSVLSNFLFNTTVLVFPRPIETETLALAVFKYLCWILNPLGGYHKLEISNLVNAKQIETKY